jgi:hypothetical protein
MTEDEHNEPSIIVESHAVVDPDAMMIKLLNADITHTAMFRPCWLNYFAGFTVVLLLIHYIIISVSF